MLIDSGAIDTSLDDGWHVDLGRLDPSAVPSTLTGVLQARLDALVADERRALQCASVMGRVFWDAAVAALSDDASGTEAALAATRRRELVFLRGQSSLEGTAEYVFKHALLCDVTYQTVLLRERQPLHRARRRLAGGDGRRAGGRVPRDDRRPSSGRRTARPGCGPAVAGRPDPPGYGHAKCRPEVTRHRGRALGGGWPRSPCRGGGPARRGLPPSRRRRGRGSRAGTSAAARILRLVPGRGPVPPEPGRVVAGGSGTRALAPRRGSTPRRRRLAAPVCHTRSPAWPGPISSWVRSTGLRDMPSEACCWRSTSAQPGETCRALNVAGVVAGERGDLAASQGFVERQLVVAEESGNLEEQSRAQDNLGVIHHLRGDAEDDQLRYRSATVHYERARILNRRLGKRSAEITTMANLAQLYVRLGRDDGGSCPPPRRTVGRDLDRTAADPSPLHADGRRSPTHPRRGRASASPTSACVWHSRSPARSTATRSIESSLERR